MRILPIPFRPFVQQAKLILKFAHTMIGAAVAGARGGKTEVGRRIFAQWAWEQPDYRRTDIEIQRPYLMAAWAPTYKMLHRIVIPGVREAIPKQLQISYNKTEHELRVRGQHGQTLIYFITASDPKRSQGVRLYRGWIDEAAIVQECMFDEALARLSDLKGKLLLTTTPRGPGWIYKRIVKQKDGDPKYVSFQQWRTIDNPYGVDADTLAMFRNTMDPMLYRQTYEASIEEFQGMVYDGWRDGIHVLDRSRNVIEVRPANVRLGPPGVRYRTFRVTRVIAGIDWGIVHPGVISIIGVTSSGEYVLLKEVRQTGTTVDEWANVAKNLHKQWRVSEWWPDPSRADDIMYFRRKAGIPLRSNTMTDVTFGIKLMKNLMHVRANSTTQFYVWNAPGFIDEVHTYEWQQNKMTGYAREAPVKMRDDSLDSVRYAIASDYRYRSQRDPKFRATQPHDLQQYLAGLTKVRQKRA